MDPSRCLITPPALILATRRVRTPLRFSVSVEEAILKMIARVTVMTTTGIMMMIIMMMMWL